MKIPHFLYILSLTAASFMMAGCSDDPEPVPVPKPVERPQWSVDYTGNDSEPAWAGQVPPSGKYQFSMTAAVTLSDYLGQFADDGDIIAAFVGNECRGSVKSQVYDGKRLFLLHIRGNADESQKVTLKYYSARNRHIYECPRLIEFEPNDAYGSLMQPAVPPFDATAKYPDSMTVTLSIENHPSGALNHSDMLGAFAGDECRGLAVPVMNEGRLIYTMEIRGRKNETANLTFKFYSQTNAGIYTATETIPFTPGSTAGTPAEPFPLTLTPVTN